MGQAVYACPMSQLIVLDHNMLIVHLDILNILAIYVTDQRDLPPQWKNPLGTYTVASCSLCQYSNEGQRVFT